MITFFYLLGSRIIAIHNHLEVISLLYIEA